MSRPECVKPDGNRVAGAGEALGFVWLTLARTVADVTGGGPCRQQLESYIYPVYLCLDHLSVDTQRISIVEHPAMLIALSSGTLRAGLVGIAKACESGERSIGCAE